ncbi:hypothetical protein [Mucilaginibacter celer]|uniref:Toprim domain-containing protein n=1 Tax=Mucilaginibacter celer TaxID=2305508 RepID=A0A494VLD8_9SPHI|nr:hypothetical protein [Mucilaginibacter celer]AYL95334.1 hypothetical protein HYN43_008505 [Mucilaginibacter celer]
MPIVLSDLEISTEVRCFFALTTEAVFDYGNDRESFDEKGHRVPSTRNVWLGGNRHAQTLIVVYSVVEAVAMLTINFQRFSNLDNLAVIALGTRVRREQMDWIRQAFPRRKIVLAFGNDLAARITDIKAAAWLQQHYVRISYHDQLVTISKNETTRFFNAESLTLVAYKRMFGIRNNFRTMKPKLFNTFLEQIKYDASRRHTD